MAETNLTHYLTGKLPSTFNSQKTKENAVNINLNFSISIPQIITSKVEIKILLKKCEIGYISWIFTKDELEKSKIKRPLGYGRLDKRVR